MNPGFNQFAGLDEAEGRRQVFDVERHRANDNYTRRELAWRILWMAGETMVRTIPRPLYEARNRVLRAFGARIGRAVRIYPTVRIAQPWNLRVGDEATIGDSVWLYSLGSIQIGAGVMISQRAHLCAGSHDYTRANLPLLKSGIEVGEATWICAEAFVGPGCVIGAYSIVGARAVVMGPFPAFSIIGGNPARRLKSRPLPTSSSTA